MSVYVLRMQSGIPVEKVPLVGKVLGILSRRTLL